MMFIKYYRVLPFLLLPFLVIGSDADTLEKKLAYARNDTARVKILVKLVWTYYNNDFNKALDYGRKALELSAKIGSKNLTASANNALGAAYYEKGEFPKALQYYLRSLRFREEIYDTLGMAAGYSNVGSVYYSQREISTALEYYRKSLFLKQQINDTKGIAYSLSAIGVIYFENKNLDSAESCWLQSMTLCERLGEQPCISQNYSNLALLYKEKKDFKKALDFTRKSLVMDSLNNDTYGVMTSYLNLADVLRLMGRLSEAMFCQRKVLDIAHERKDFEYIKFAYIGLSASFESSGKADSALKYHKLYADYRDSLYSGQSQRQINELQTQYQTEKKEKENELLRKEKELQQSEINRQRYFIVFIALFLMLVAVLAFFIYRGYLNKKKANITLERKNVTISLQKDEIEKQKKLVEEKNRDITDSMEYASKIQKSMFTSGDYIGNALGKLREDWKDGKMEGCLPAGQAGKNGNNFFIFHRPKDIVSGDFYWAAEKNGYFIMVVGDCTGHGVPGAMMSMLGINILDEIVVEQGITGPDEILNMMRVKIIHAVNPQKLREIKDGMDATVVTIDLVIMNETGRQGESETGRFPTGMGNDNGTGIRIATANHRFFVAGAEGLKEFVGDSMPVGVLQAGEETPFRCHSLSPEKGDMLYLLTDGYADQFGGPKQKKFKTQNLVKLFSEISGIPIDEQKAALQKTFEEWKGGGEQTDDVTVIGIRI
ncbi:MAG: tetratricopeptide repeat protein [Bacteroidetes bacterium]|nr:tetratricopeptide repeat protein [Bacteroidota bacterium]